MWTHGMSGEGVINAENGEMSYDFYASNGLVQMGEHFYRTRTFLIGIPEEPQIGSLRD